MNFNEVYNKLATQFITEQPTNPQAVPPATGATPTAPAPSAAPDPSAAPTPPPAAPAKPFDKPYQDLAKLLYKALRLRFEDLPTEEQDRITAVTPEGEDSIDSDEKGVALFDAVDKLVKSNEMPQTEEE